MGRWLVPGLFAATALAIGRSAVEAIVHAGDRPGSRTLLIALYYVLRTAVALAFAAFTVNRGEPQKHAREPLAVGACVVAVIAVLAFAPPSTGGSTTLVLIGDLLAVVSCLWLLAAVLALGRCFGVLPEARGLVTRGPYRLVRHPVYLGEIGACLALALTSPSVRNGAVMALFVAAQAVRMRYEERALTFAFPDYRAYAAHTPRLMPRLGLFGTARTIGGTPSHGELPGVGEPLRPILTDPVPRR